MPASRNVWSANEGKMSERLERNALESAKRDGKRRVAAVMTLTVGVGARFLRAVRSGEPATATAFPAAALVARPENQQMIKVHAVVLTTMIAVTTECLAQRQSSQMVFVYTIPARLSTQFMFFPPINERGLCSTAFLRTQVAK